MFIRDEYDVIIVGSGPAGSSTALNLAKKGFDVLVVDRNQEIGTPKRCAEGIGIAGLKKSGLSPDKFWIDQEIDGAILFAPNEKRIDVNYNNAAGFIVDRKKFDKWLALKAVENGAQVFAKTYVTDVIKENDYVKGVKLNFMGQEKEVRAKMIIGADGVESVIAKKAGLDVPVRTKLFDSGFQYEMSGIDLLDQRKLEFFLGNEIAPRGYIWIFPKGENRANVGIGIVADHEKTAKYYLDKFVENHERLNKGSVIEVNGGSIPVGGLMKNMVLNGFAVVGDAAHQVHPIHGGGIAEAMIAGKILADVSAECLEKNDVSKEALSKYNKVWWEERGETLSKIEKGREIFEKLSDKQMNLIAEDMTQEKLEDITSGNVSKFLSLTAKVGIQGIKDKIGLK